MLDQIIKNAFIAESKKLDNISDLARLLQKRLSPGTVACYNSSTDNFKSLLANRDWQSISFRAANYFELEAVITLPLLLTYISFVAPEETFSIMEAIVKGWTAKSTPPLRKDSKTGEIYSARQISQALSNLFWQQVEVDDNIIEGVFNIPGAFDPELNQAYARAMQQHQGIVEAFNAGFLRSPMQINQLSGYDPGTLGYAYYHQIVDNGLDIEILKGNQQIAKSGDLIDYVNQRILQTHDLWHCLTGYSTDGIDEIALQAFQLAQLGNPFSPILLAILLTRSVLLDPASVRPLMQAICSGWQHGLNTSTLFPVKWEEYWSRSIADLRKEYQVKPVDYQYSNFG